MRPRWTLVTLRAEAANLRGFSRFPALARFVLLLRLIKQRREGCLALLERPSTMRRYSRYVTSFVFTALALTFAGSGCSAIGEAIDCDQMCNQLQVCVDSDLDVDHCTDRCEDKADDNTLRRQLDDCTDCLDRDYACAEIPDHCEACQTVTDALL